MVMVHLWFMVHVWNPPVRFVSRLTVDVLSETENGGVVISPAKLLPAQPHCRSHRINITSLDGVSVAWILAWIVTAVTPTEVLLVYRDTAVYKWSQCKLNSLLLTFTAVFSSLLTSFCCKCCYHRSFTSHYPRTLYQTETQSWRRSPVNTNESCSVAFLKPKKLDFLGIKLLGSSVLCHP